MDFPADFPEELHDCRDGVQLAEAFKGCPTLRDVDLESSEWLVNQVVMLQQLHASMGDTALTVNYMYCTVTVDLHRSACSAWDNVGRLWSYSIGRGMEEVPRAARCELVQ